MISLHFMLSMFWGLLTLVSVGGKYIGVLLHSYPTSLFSDISLVV